MNFPINASNGVPIFDQIARHVTFAVADGRLKPGQTVPSIRSAAESLAVNANTVARAYRQLQADGVLAPVRGTGLEVSKEAVKACRNSRKKLVRDRLIGVLEELHHLGVAPDEIRAIVEAELNLPKHKAAEQRSG